jgi:hypothetical protein
MNQAERWIGFALGTAVVLHGVFKLLAEHHRFSKPLVIRVRRMAIAVYVVLALLLLISLARG